MTEDSPLAAGMRAGSANSRRDRELTKFPVAQNPTVAESEAPKALAETRTCFS